MQKIKEKVRQQTSRRISISMEDRLKLLNRLLMGWISYFRIIDTPSVLEGLDCWIRRRLRMCLLKQWKQPKTRLRELVKLGVPREKAVLISSSGKGYWRLARTPQLHKALGLKYWKEKGLVSLADRYSSLCLVL